MAEEVEASLSDWNRRGALEEIDNLKSIRATAWEQHSHSFKWLMASLLAINGGACISIINLQEISIHLRLWASGAFVVGILAALLVAVFGQHSVQKSLAPLQKMIGYWMAVADDGERVEEMEAELASELKDSAKIGYGSRIAGWVSALAFVIGIAIIGSGLPSEALDKSPKSEEMP